MDKRLIALTDWVKGVLGDAAVTVRPASSDASFRRYFRVTAGHTSYIVMDAPPEREQIAPFVRVAEQLLNLGLNVPEILARDIKSGYLLLSDLGSTLYLTALTSETADSLYTDALRSLSTLQSGHSSEPSILPRYDHRLLIEEMELFRRWFLGTHLEMELSLRQHRDLDKLYEELAQNALAQPQVWVHRDYHCRNLTYTTHNNPGILDFQDAVVGPVTYDLVSLLRDCYISWPPEQVEHWALQYFDLARDSGIPVGDDLEQFLRWFDLMGVQRHLKAIGIFARLYHRDAKSGYLEDIPRVLSYVNSMNSRYSSLAPLGQLLQQLPPRLTPWTQ